MLENILPLPRVSSKNGPSVVGVGGQALAERDLEGCIGWVGWMAVCKGCFLSAEYTFWTAAM